MMKIKVGDEVLVIAGKEKGKNGKSFKGFKIFCKVSTAASTFVTAILSALFARMIHGRLASKI